jgi:hypothetical protein
VGERGGQRVEQDAVGDDFAVDEHAVAVADKVIEHDEEEAGVGDAERAAMIRVFAMRPAGLGDAGGVRLTDSASVQMIGRRGEWLRPRVRMRVVAQAEPMRSRRGATRFATA